MINILHLVYNFNMGGAERMVAELLTSDSIINETTSSLVIMAGGYNETLANSIRAKGVQVTIFDKNQHFKRLDCLLRLIRIVLNNKINIIHIHAPTCQKWASLLKLIFPGLKIVHTTHGTRILPNQSKIENFLTRCHADRVAAVSNSVLDECNLLNYKHAILIYNSIDLQKFNLPKSKNSKTFQIINVARIDSKIKGHDILIKALGECKKQGLNFKCRFAGEPKPGNNYTLPILKELIEKLELANEIEFLGTRTDVAELLAESDLFILPSRQEGLPVSLLEAMAAKTATLASNIDSNTYVIEHGKNGLLFKSEDHVDLAEKILYAANNTQHLEKIQNRAFEYVQDFDKTVMSREYIKLYEKLLGK